MKITLITILLFFFDFGNAQTNLVPNSSFEDTVNCPAWMSQIELSQNWHPFGGTPDFFNSCNAGGYVGVPSNWQGYQEANTGNAYAGLIVYGELDGYREFLGVELTEPTIINQTYYISAYLSFTVPDQYYGIAINNMGIRFSTNSFSDSIPTSTNNFAHVLFPEMIVDTLNWTLVEGTFIADSVYTYLSFGNFFDNANTDTVITSSTNPVASYYYIDDLCVSTDPLTCIASAGLDEATETKKKLMKIIDTMGRETEDKPNATLIYIYSDGTTEKVFRAMP